MLLEKKARNTANKFELKKKLSKTIQKNAFGKELKTYNLSKQAEISM